MRSHVASALPDEIRSKRMHGSGISGNIAWTASTWVRQGPTILCPSPTTRGLVGRRSSSVSRMHLLDQTIRRNTHNTPSANAAPTASFIVPQSKAGVSRDVRAAAAGDDSVLFDVMFGTTVRQSGAPTAFGALHKQYVASLYRRFLRDSLNWHIQRDLWRADAQRIRAEFEHNRNVRSPRELANILSHAEEKLASRLHPDPYKRT